MKLHRTFRWVLVVLLPLMVMGFASTRVMAQSDPPGRVGRLNLTEGPVTFSPAGDSEWIEAELNRPFTRGDKLWTDKGSRAEIQVGSSSVRMDGQTQIEVLKLDDQSTQLSLTKGTVYLRVRSLPEGENFEIDTPNLAYRAAYPGDYRIDVDAARGTTRVTIHSGTGAVYGDKGQALPLGGGQQVTFKTRALTQVTAQESPPQDNFDRWAAERNRREDQSVSARYVPREVVGYQQLDSHGQWTQDATYGAVWTPAGTPANWAPYRVGRWEWVEPWGWTWLDDAPWGFATSHYGRWTQINSRWAWVPGRIGLRPIYAPALVAFIGAGTPGVAWFPLAPGEAWQPGFRATPLYISNVNRNMPPATTSYAWQRKPEALTAISTEDFHRGKPVRGSWMKVAANVVANAQIVPPPAMPERASRNMLARTVTPAQADIRQVANAVPSAQQQAEAQRQAKAAMELERTQAEQAKAAQQTKAFEQAKASEQGKLAEQARLAEQTKQAEQTKALEQLRVAQLAKTAEHQKTAELAKARQAKLAEQAKLAQQARLAERANLEQQAKLAEQARAAERSVAELQAKAAQAKFVAAQQARVARQAEQGRGAEQARLAEQMHRAAQAKIAQPGKRGESKTEALARRTEAKREQLAARDQVRREVQVKREQQLVAARAQARAEEQVKRAEQARRAAVARHEEQARHAAHAQQVELARRSAERDAQVLREQRAQREAIAARKLADEREQAQREAWQRQQQALGEQWRRDQAAWEQQQRERSRTQRPDLRRAAPPAEPEIWQRGIPILNSGRTS